MTQRDITGVLVDVIDYRYFRPSDSDQDAVYGFTHSFEVNAICADFLPPHVVTQVDKTDLEDALDEYAARNDISAADAATIRAWLDGLPDDIAIIERSTNPAG